MLINQDFTSAMWYKGATCFGVPHRPELTEKLC